MSRVLVTGAAGFIGRHTLAPLAAAGHELHATTSRPLRDGLPDGTPELDDELRASGPEVRWHEADLLAPGAADTLMAQVRPTHLLHLAWYTESGAFWTALENLAWVQASIGLLRAFGAAGGRRAAVAGTCSEYAQGHATHCVEETPAPASADGGRPPASAPDAPPTPMRPATLYGAAKHGLHVVAERWAAQVGVELAWGRVFPVYGPHEHPARLVSAVARALTRGEEARCTMGTQICDYLYVEEMGSAMAALLDSRVVGPVNLASGQPVRVAEMVRAIATAAGRPELVRLGALPQRAGEAERLTADVRRLREEVGWSPSIDLAEGTVRTVAWWRRAQAAESAPPPIPRPAEDSGAPRAVR